MADSYTTRLGLIQSQVNGDVGTWAPNINTTWQMLDDAFGTTTISITGLSTYTITNSAGTEGASYENRYAGFIFTGALTGNCTVTIPGVEKYGRARNNTTGGFNVILTLGSGNTASIPNDDNEYEYYTDGSTGVSNRNVGFHTLTTASTLLVNAGGIVINGVATLYNSATIGAGGLNCTGNSVFNNNLTVDGTFSNPSDIRVKRDVQDITPDDGMRWALGARPVSFEFPDGRKSTGFIAQEEAKRGYSVVETPCDDLPGFIDADGFESPPEIKLGIDYLSRIAYLTAALKAAFARIEALEAKA